MDPAVVATTFVPLLLLELPDKTFIATLVLATRFPPILAWCGVGLAFAVQCVVAVAAGGLLSSLPDRPVAAAAAVLFALGALLLLRGAGRADAQGEVTERDFEHRIGSGAPGVRAVGASFMVVFVAEWGDLSQLFTAGLAARYGDPVSVFVGAWAALLVVSGLAAVLGRALLRRLSLSTVRQVGGAVCLVLAALAAGQALGASLPL